MNYYESPLAWSRLILEGFSPLTMQGKSNAFSLLFPMETVFESYAANILKQHIPKTLRLKTQASSEYLVKHKGKKRFRLQPDLLLCHVTGKDEDKNSCVLDTKWKLVSDHNEDDEKSKYGLSQSDFYQMFAYGHKYLKGKGELFLIYPSHDEFDMPIEHSFDFYFGDNLNENVKLRLWVVPLDISVDKPGKQRFKWPKDSSLNQSVD